MTRTLILMRHAKSSWDDPGLDDHERPLNKRGRRSAAALGRWLTRRDYLPDEVLSSDAARTRETWHLTGLTARAVRFLPALYSAGPDEILETLRGATGRTVMVLGHNPGIGVLAGELAEEPPSHARFYDYPTGATTVFDFPGKDWRAIAARRAAIREFVVPRDLSD